jgi:hypothetical protein
MANEKECADIILNELDHQWSQAKQSEDQRAILSNFIVVIAVASEGFVVDRDFPKRALVVAISMIVLGLFGAVASAKYYERFRLAMARVGRLREKLDLMYPQLGLDVAEKRADLKHAGRHSILRRIRLNFLWRLMMFGIALLGMFNVYMICKFGH